MIKVADISAELHEISTTVAGIERINPFSVPDNYFATFPEKILAIIYQYEIGSSSPKEEIESISPLLASLRTKQTLSVPQGYFEQFTFEAPNQANRHKEIPVVSVHSFSTGKKWLRYAAAAAIAGLIGLGIVFFLNNSTDIPADSTVNQKELTSEQSNNNSLTNLNEISDNVLDEYLAEMPVGLQEPDSAESAFFNLAILNIDDKGVSDLLHEFSDEDLQSFAEANKVYLSL